MPEDRGEHVAVQARGEESLDVGRELLEVTGRDEAHTRMMALGAPSPGAPHVEPLNDRVAIGNARVISPTRWRHNRVVASADERDLDRCREQ